MMLKLWQKKLKLDYSKDIYDIVQFGSSLVEDSKPNDVDIAVIYHNVPLKEQLLQSQKIKRQLENYTELSVDIISFDMIGLFDKGNFAKESILLNGYSLITGKPFVYQFGLIPKIQIYYDLINLEKKEKIRFNYMLSGKKGEYGLLRKYQGKLLKPGLIEILPEYEFIFTSAISKFNIKSHLKKILFF